MIKVIFFDLDNTLWNHNLALKKTIESVYDYLLENYSIPKDKAKFIDMFNECNVKVWTEYKEGKISQKEVRINRFIDLLAFYGISDKDLVIKLDEFYISLYPTWPVLFEGATELLEQLKGKYALGLITNGFPITQEVKLKNANIKHYFNWIVYSEAVGKTKPNKEIFDYALKEAGISGKEAVYIGDEFDVDIIGAKNAGMKTIWVRKQDNRSGKLPEIPATASLYADYMVTDLKEIVDIVKSIESC